MTTKARRYLLVVVAALVLLVGAVSATPTEGHTEPATAPVATPLEWQAHVFWDQARFRNFPNQTVPWVCVDNHSPFALQTMAEQWDARITDGRVYYEQPSNCSTFWERETIDVFGTDYPNGPCIWKSVTYDGNYYANVNVYLNTNAAKASECYPTTIGSNHRKSNAIGVGLGAQQFDKFHDGTPVGIYVMDRANLTSVSYASGGDGGNWDFRYGAH